MLNQGKTNFKVLAKHGHHLSCKGRPLWGQWRRQGQYFPLLRGEADGKERESKLTELQLCQFARVRKGRGRMRRSNVLTKKEFSVLDKGYLSVKLTTERR